MQLRQKTGLAQEKKNKPKLLRNNQAGGECRFQLLGSAVVEQPFGQSGIA